MTRCPLLRTGRAWAASGSMCEVTPRTTPIGSNKPLYGRTDTNPPMVYSSMVYVAGGEGGSTRRWRRTVRPLRFRCRPGRAEQTLDGGLENVDDRTGQCGSDVGPVLRRRVRAAPPGPGVDRLEDLLDGREYRPAVVDQREELRAASIHVALES